MDRIHAMLAFVAAVDGGSLAAASRRLGRSPAAVTRALAFLERRAGTRLLQRTTRRLRLTEAGERYLASCRRVLAELEAADLLAAGERSAPRGLLAVTAPALFGRLHVRPVVDAFLDVYPETQVRLLLIDRVVNLVEEGMDVALRIGELPESSLVAQRLGTVRRVVCASPAYLDRRGTPAEPGDLAQHDCIVSAQSGMGEPWRFAGGPAGPGSAMRRARMQPRLVVNGAEAAIASAVEGHGLTRVLSYQIEAELAAGRLALVLEDFEPMAAPVHLVYPEARLATARLRAFLGLAVPALKTVLARLSAALGGG